jgi:UDP-glucose 4-epimerase
VIDNLSSGFRSNIADSSPIERIIEASVEDVDLHDIGEVDGVFHLAAQASVPLSISAFASSSSTNVLSAIKVIDYCSSTDVPLVYASSSAVYGNLPFGSESLSVDLLSPYAVDKLVMEMYCEVAQKLRGLPSYGLRFFNVYGPRQDPSNPYSGVISIFAHQILLREPITMNGGHQTRDFIYVEDVVRGLWASYLYLTNNPVSVVSNLLTGKSTSIDGLADQLMKLAGHDVKKIYQPLPKGDPEKSLGSMKLMQELLNIQEFVELGAGLNAVLAWMKMSDE